MSGPITQVIIEPVQEEQSPDQIPIQPPILAPNIVENDDMGPTLPPEGARSGGSGDQSPVGYPVEQCPRSHHCRDYDNPKWKQDGDGRLQQKEMHNFVKMSQSEFNKTKANMS